MTSNCASLVGSDSDSTGICVTDFTWFPQFSNSPVQASGCSIPGDALRSKCTFVCAHNTFMCMCMCLCANVGLSRLMLVDTWRR